MDLAGRLWSFNLLQAIIQCSIQCLFTREIIPEQFTVKAHPALFISAERKSNPEQSSNLSRCGGHHHNAGIRLNYKIGWTETQFSWSFVDFSIVKTLKALLLKWISRFLSSFEFVSKAWCGRLFNFVWTTDWKTRPTMGKRFYSENWKKNYYI